VISIVLAGFNQAPFLSLGSQHTPNPFFTTLAVNVGRPALGNNENYPDRGTKAHRLAFRCRHADTVFAKWTSKNLILRITIAARLRVDLSLTQRYADLLTERFTQELILSSQAVIQHQ
jgi:hypothetical protein